MNELNREHEVGYPKCEGCGDSIPGIIVTETGLCHEMCCKDVPTPSEAEKAIQWKMAQPRMGDKALRFLTLCCNYEFLADECSVMWNEFNKTVQCHNCGHVYEPKEYPRHSGQAVDRQEWTLKVEGDGLYFGTGYWDIGEVNAKTLETTIATALAAERQRVTHIMTLKMDEYRKQLAAERQHAEQAELECGRWRLACNSKASHDRITELEQRLLSALAAIEKHNSDPMSEDCPLIEVDLSLLHQHDAKKAAELRDKWLVEVKESMELHDAALRAQWDKEHEHVL